jgi:hypothetical protein
MAPQAPHRDSALIGSCTDLLDERVIEQTKLTDQRMQRVRVELRAIGAAFGSNDMCRNVGQCDHLAAVERGGGALRTGIQGRRSVSSDPPDDGVTDVPDLPDEPGVRHLAARLLWLE